MSRRRWHGSVLDPKPIGRGPAPLFTHPLPGDHEDEPTHTVQGSLCVIPEHQACLCPGNDHGGWLDMAEMLRAAADAMEVPGCDVRLLLGGPTDATILDGKCQPGGG